MYTSDEWIKVIGAAGLKEVLRFQAEMVGRRAAMGWTPKDLRKAISDRGFSFNPETGSLAWKMSDVQEWCMVLGGRLTVTFPGVPEPDMEMFDMLVGAMANVMDADAADRYRAVRYLAMSRLKAEISAKDMAKLINITRDGVHNWESNSDNPVIPGLFRHAHALGGSVHLGFTENQLVKGPNGR